MGLMADVGRGAVGLDTAVFICSSKPMREGGS